MFIISNPIRLYGRKVVTDLALRSGSVTANSFSASTGLASTVDSMWSEPTLASKEYLFQGQVDFDADKIQPHFREYDYEQEQLEYDLESVYDPSRDTTDFDKYFRRLEDIDGEYIAKYVNNLVYTICKLNGGAKAFNYNHALAPTIYDVEDNSASELADLELDGQKDAWSETAVNEALTKLPYVLKRLHNLSRYTGIHMLSFVCSYMLAREHNARAQQAGSTRVLKKNAVIARNVWTCDKNGNAVHKVLVSNKNLKAFEVFDWIEGTVDKYHGYSEDVTNFMHYVKVLNIDISGEMQKYGSEFIRKLTITTLTPNTQYNPKVHQALLTGGLVLEDNGDDLVEICISRFREACYTNEDLKAVQQELNSEKQDSHLEMAKILHRGYCMATGKICDSNYYDYYDGFLYYDGELVVIDSCLFTDMTFADGRCVISELGYVVKVSDSLLMYLMTVYCAKENMMAKINRDSEEALNKWWTISL